MYRIDIGAKVRARLESVADIKRVPSPAWAISSCCAGTLSERQCEALIGMIEKDRRPSQLLSSDNPDANFRTSETCILDGNKPVVRDVEAKLTALLGIEPGTARQCRGNDMGLVSNSSPTATISEPPKPIGPSRKGWVVSGPGQRWFF